nr:hypothetical protein [uncultured Friedmanniella sp.]
MALMLALAGCGPAAGSEPVATASPSASAPTAPVTVPADGRALRGLGYSFGPLDSFSLPADAVLVASVDQADNVTAVLSRPPAREVADYLRRALPLAGFAVTADDPAGATLTFTGHGWAGSFTGGAGSSAVVLRPAQPR